MIDALVAAIGGIDPSTALRVFVEGLAKGGLYVMIASGLTLVFGLMGVLNFAHGSFTMIGAYAGGGLVLALWADWMGLWTTLLLFLVVMVAIFLLLAALGSAFEVSLISKLYGYPPIYQILLTFGLTLVLDEAMAMIVQFTDINNGEYLHTWTAPFQTVPDAIQGSVSLGIASVRGIFLIQILLGAATVVAIWAFLTKTRYGLYVRAGAEDTEMAMALGIDVRQTFTVVFAIGAAVAGAAGVMLMWDRVWGANVPLAQEVLLPAFVIVIVGGLGSFKGSVVAAYLVGMVDAVTTWMFQTGIVGFVGLPEMMIFVILVVMLIVRPEGLYGVEGAGEH